MSSHMIFLVSIRLGAAAIFAAILSFSSAVGEPFSADAYGIEPSIEFEDHPDIDLPGADIDTLQDMTLDRCRSACAGESRCQAFTFNQDVSWCFLKEAGHGFSRHEGAFSSIKRIARPDPDTAAADRRHLPALAPDSTTALSPRIASCDIKSNEDCYEASDFLRRLFFVAIHEADEELVRLILATGIDTSVRDDAGWSPLMWAARMGRVAIVAMLLDHGADPNEALSDGTTPLHIAAALGNGGAVRAMLRSGANPNLADASRLTPLQAAIINEYPKTARSIVQYGGDASGRYADGTPILADEEDLSRVTLADAVVEGDVGLANRLLTEGADVNALSDGEFTPLTLAAFKGNYSMVKLLLEHGADVNALHGRLTPLMAAMHSGNMRVVIAMVSRASKEGVEYRVAHPVHRSLTWSAREIAEFKAEFLGRVDLLSVLAPCNQAAAAMSRDHFFYVTYNGCDGVGVERQALESCAMAGKEGCKLAASFRGTCFAVATNSDRSGSWFVTDLSAEAAEYEALTKCLGKYRDCKVDLSICSRRWD